MSDNTTLIQPTDHTRRISKTISMELHPSKLDMNNNNSIPNESNPKHKRRHSISTFDPLSLMNLSHQSQHRYVSYYDYPSFLPDNSDSWNLILFFDLSIYGFYSQAEQIKKQLIHERSMKAHSQLERVQITRNKKGYLDSLCDLQLQTRERMERLEHQQAELKRKR